MKKGLSIVEVMVALMLVTIGLLGIAGSSTLALRQVTDAAARRSATTSAVSRFSSLAAQGCLRASSGSYASSHGTVREHWVVTGSPAFAHVTDTVTWTSPRGARTLTLASAFTC